MRVEYTRRAQAEALAARDGLASLEPKTVAGFERRLDEAIARLQSFPNLGRSVGSDVRALLLLPYPFVLLYRVVDDTIQILGVPHVRARER